MSQYPPLTADDLAALNAYVREHGRTWKRDLSVEWTNATTSGPLHALRNSHGPMWLHSFQNPTVPYTCEHCGTRKTIARDLAEKTTGTRRFCSYSCAQAAGAIPEGL